jgi:TM2 domain-containing membrane protein YozV
MRYLVGKDATDPSMTNPTGRRRAIVAFFLSGVFPGLGQFYNHQALKGGAFVVAGIALSWLIGRVVPTDLMALASVKVGTDTILLLGLLLAIWLWSAVDAWRVGSR